MHSDLIAHRSGPQINSLSVYDLAISRQETTSIEWFGGWPTLSPLPFSLSIRWVPLDKSEGLVKQKLSLAMRKHRCVGQRLLTTEDTGKHLYLNHPSVEGFAVAFCLPFHQSRVRNYSHKNGFGCGVRTVLNVPCCLWPSLNSTT